MAFQQSQLAKLAQNYLQTTHFSIDKLPQSGSARQYFRIKTEKRSIIGVYNDDLKENEAFFSFTQSFLQQQIPVPQLLAIAEDRTYYLLNDLGNETLYSFLCAQRKFGNWTDELTNIYKKVIAQLPKIQLAGRNNIDFSKCYPRFAFDRQSMQWDLNYFKYFFLKLANIPFDEQLLEDDFQYLIEFLLEADSNFFLYRDFQSRNIMIQNGEVYFIDYQGGRKGALQYDVASLLYDGKADIPENIREELFQYYMECLSREIPIDKDKFAVYYHAFVLIRIMQAMGAYGFRGYYEKKTHFLLSIPFAVRNIRYLLENQKIPNQLSYLKEVLKKITESDFVKSTILPQDKLTISVTSFSYKKGIPEDVTGNGGGFVFDCRALPNPGRETAYKQQTGMDRPVIEYLEQYAEVEEFKTHTQTIVFSAARNYLERKFNHLAVNFGCTGGQHRSVYFAQSMADALRKQFPEINVILTHREQSKN